MIEERLDLAVRSGEMTNPSLVTRRLGMLPRIAVAAPAYLERRGSPCLHEDLMNHDCIVRRTSESDSKWRLTDGDGSVDVAVRGAVSTNSHEIARNAALRGLGIAVLPEYTVVDDIKSGRLRLVLRRYTSKKLPIYVVYPSRRHLAPRTRAVIDFLIEEVRRLHSHRIDRDWPAITQENDPGTRDREIVALVS
jgi:DNA-binding transcriptional LysR family regulator